MTADDIDFEHGSLVLLTAVSVSSKCNLAFAAQDKKIKQYIPNGRVTRIKDWAVVVRTRIENFL